MLASLALSIAQSVTGGNSDSKVETLPTPPPLIFLTGAGPLRGSRHWPSGTKTEQHNFEQNNSQGALLSKIAFEANNGPDQLPHPLQSAEVGPARPCHGTVVKDLDVP